ncbi:hypothetical protein DW954_01980 [Clostridium sp. AM45-5]|jgi:hypothetical protein|nr:hypothetical protein [Clostridium sp. AM45-5]RHS68131.1 hypothetical protein DW954_01980 [Clostridium sp. AM45-5]
MTLSYEKIFSVARGLCTDPKELSLSLDDLTEIYTERLNRVVGDVRVENMFSTLEMDDEVQRMEFVLNHPVSDGADTRFIVRLLSLGMAIEWLQPHVDSILYVDPFIATTQEKKILDGHPNMINRLDSLKLQFNKMIRDHGCIHNSYLEQEG